MALLAPADPAPAKTELEFSIKQAREQLRLAELEHLPSRRRVTSLAWDVSFRVYLSSW
jgi:hypothetical protein